MSRKFEIDARDGKANAWYFAPSQSSNSSVILYMDIFGIRPALFQIAERFAGMGHHVLLPDLYYRLGAYKPRSTAEVQASPDLLAQVRAMRDQTHPSLTAEDTVYFVDALTAIGALGKVAAVGYCMGGARAMRAADVVPERIAAAASIHGGNLATDSLESPHHNLRHVKARVYIGSAGVDPTFPPSQSAKLAEALRSAEIDHQIENYAGCAHGWAIPDNPIFNELGSERHWRRLATLFDETLC